MACGGRIKGFYRESIHGHARNHRSLQRPAPGNKKIFYETLPPGLELKQILTGGALWQCKTLSIFPDVYSAANQKAMQALASGGHIRDGDAKLYLHNRLTLMVPQGNTASNQKKTVDVGPVWVTEAVQARQACLDFELLFGRRLTSAAG